MSEKRRMMAKGYAMILAAFIFGAIVLSVLVSEIVGFAFLGAGIVGIGAGAGIHKIVYG